jgi:alkanesulfonate monooxygenase SsuD/methylene tetrahydromethanopterin reductase-like flavin-dependent oxidoreductase (luciferase family)
MQELPHMKKLRGRNAIEAAHAGMSGEDEVRLESAISTIYGVSHDEAAEIHTNYHVDRIFLSLSTRALANGMKREAILQRFQELDFVGMALQVAQGKIAEPAAVEVLFRSLARLETSGKVEDRYLSFYG